jgi:hypothetical protein
MGAYPPGEGQLLGSTQRYQDGLESVECTQWATALLPRDGMQCHAAGCSCSGYVACMVGTSVGSPDAVLAAYIGNARVDALRAIHPQRPSTACPRWAGCVAGEGTAGSICSTGQRLMGVAWHAGRAHSVACKPVGSAVKMETTQIER